MWANSSAGRALAWHVRGRRFNPDLVHQSFLSIGTLSADDKENLQRSLANLQFTRPGKELNRLFDEGRHSPLPQNCGIEQIAVWHEPVNTVEVSRDLWSHLSSLDQAALLLHEAIYQYHRAQMGHVTSEEARRLVGLIFSQAGLFPWQAGLLTDSFYCGAVTGLNTTDGLTLQFFRDISKPSSTSMRIVEVKGVNVAPAAQEIPAIFGLDNIYLDHSAEAPFIGKIIRTNANAIVSAQLPTPIHGIHSLEIEFKTNSPIKITMKSQTGQVLNSAGVISCNRTGFEP
jgi:hypothetical protein